MRHPTTHRGEGHVDAPSGSAAPAGSAGSATPPDTTTVARPPEAPRRRARGKVLGAVALVVAVTGAVLAVTAGDDAEEGRTATPTTTALRPPSSTAATPTTATTSVPEHPTGRPGALDTSFGTGGTVTTFLRVNGRVQHARVTASAIDAQGRIVAAGDVETGADAGGRRLALARYLPDGAPDLSFGSGGSVITGVAGGAGGVFPLADGRLMVAGTGSVEAAGAAARAIVFLARFATDGSPDAAFGDSGLATVACGASCESGEAALQADGRVLLATTTDVEGDEGGDIALYRLDASGRLDPTYGDRGVARLGAGRATAVAVDGAGRALVAGRTPSGALVARLTAAGSLDPTFGGGGQVVVDLEAGTSVFLAVAAQQDHRVVVAGSRGDHGSEIVLLRLLPDGRPDPGFGSTGRVVTPGAAANAYPLDVLVGPGGEVVVAGVHGLAMLVARYDAAGRLDAAFGERGFTDVRFGGRVDGPGGAHGLLRLGDGRLVAAGYTSSAAENRSGFAVVRLHG